MLPELPVFFSAVFSRSRLGQTMCCADQGRTLYHTRHPRRLGPSAAIGNDRYRALLEIHRRVIHDLALAHRELKWGEARNPKLETISNDKKIQCSKQSRFGPEFWILIFRVLKLFRISIFEFRKQAWRDDLLPSSPCLLVYGSRALYPAQRLFELAAQIGSGMPPVDKFFAIEQRQHRGFFGSEIVHGVPRLFA